MNYEVIMFVILLNFNKSWAENNHNLDRIYVNMVLNATFNYISVLSRWLTELIQLYTIILKPSIICKRNFFCTSIKIVALPSHYFLPFPSHDRIPVASVLGLERFVLLSLVIMWTITIRRLTFNYQFNLLC